MIQTFRLQAAIAGLATNLADTGVVLFAALDGASGVLLVDMARPIEPGTPVRRVGDCALLTNDSAAPDFDAVIGEADLRDAINDYFSFAGRGLLVLETAVERYNPASKIEPDGLDERGRKYRIAPDMTNGQLAVIAMCWFAVRQAGFASQLSAFDDFDADLSITTVGMAARGVSSDPRVQDYALGGTLPLGRDGWPV